LFQKLINKSHNIKRELNITDLLYQDAKIRMKTKRNSCEAVAPPLSNERKNSQSNKNSNRILWERLRHELHK